MIIPSYDASGELNYFVGRSIYKDGMKYKNPPVSKDVIGFELFINWDEPLILCEGVFDAIAVKRNAIPLFGKTIPKKLMKKIYEKQVKTIYILLDSDAYWDSIKMTDVLMRNGIDVQLIRLKDKDPSEMGFAKVIDVIKKSSKTSFSDLIRMKLNGKTKDIWKFNDDEWKVHIQMYNDILKKLYDAFGLDSSTIYYESGRLSKETAWDVIVPNSKIDKVKKFLKDNT